MNHETIEQIRARLIESMEELKGAADKTLKDMKNHQERLPDPMDQATLESHQTLELAIRYREKDMLGEIRETIDRIDQGHFGQCDQCGAAISQQRLFLAPMSRLCKSCKEKEETLLRRRGSPNGMVPVREYGC
jgi:DnaK suppressor protein